MKALALNCTLKASPETSNTEALARVVLEALGEEGVETEIVRVVDHEVRPGVTSDEGDGDQWPQIRDKVLGAEILVFATPTWLGRPSSVAQRVLERMDAMLSEQDDDGRPVAFNRVAGVVVTGNEDGAHHVISEVCGGLIDIGSRFPGRPGRTGTAARARATTTSTAMRARTGRIPPAAPRLRTCCRWRGRGRAADPAAAVVVLRGPGP